jgi:hypothetical protein
MRTGTDAVLFARLAMMMAVSSGAAAQPDEEDGANTSAWQVGDQGYVISGDWHGYAWTAVGGDSSTLTPADFSGLTAGDRLCVAGTVAGTPDYSGVAILGTNLNQAADRSDPGTVVPTLEGLLVEVDNVGGSPLRVQIQGLDGASAPDQRWCAEIAGSGFIPFAEFNTECWSGQGQPYAGEPLTAAMVLVPGADGYDIAYDFCLDALEQAGDPGVFPPPDEEQPPAVVVPTAEGNLSVESGYVIAGDWQGYSWLATDPNGSFVEPSDFDTFSGTALCVAGIVQPSSDWEAWVILGVEVNEPEDGLESNTIIPTADGLLIDVDNVGGSPLRVQIQGPDGATDPNDRWCAVLPSSGFLPWTEFNTECWSNEGAFYAGEPLQAVGILVPGSDVDQVPFAFCLKDFGEADEGSTEPAGPPGWAWHRHGCHPGWTWHRKGCYRRHAGGLFSPHRWHW